MGRKSTVISVTVIAIILCIAVAAAIVLNVVNARAERELTTQLDENLQALGMDEAITYGEVIVQSGRGVVQITDLRVSHPLQPTQISAERVSVSVPPLEAVALIRNSEAASLSQADLNVADLTVSFSEIGAGMTVESATLSLTGALSAELAGGDITTVLSDLDTINLSASEVAFEPGAAMLGQIQMILGGEWLNEEANRRIESMGLEVELRSDRISVPEIAITSPLLTASGSGTFGINAMMQPIPEEMNYRVASMHPDIRRELAWFGLNVPEDGAFTISYALGANGPELTIE